MKTKASEIIGENIRDLRKQKGIKQEVLAKYLGLSKGRISQIENGNCEELTISRIEKIAAYLQTDFFKIVTPLHTHTHDTISGLNNFISLNGVIYSLSSDLVNTLAKELANRKNK